MFRRANLLVLLLLAAGLPAVAAASEQDPPAPQTVLLTLDAPDAVIGDDRKTWSGAMDAATIARVAQSVVAAVETAGGTGSIPSYRFPYVVAHLPAGFDVLTVPGVRGVSENPTVELALNTALSTAEVSDSTPALAIGTPNTQVLRGKGQNIAVLDSGVDANHPFFQDVDGNSRVIAEACFVTLDGGGTDCPKESGAGASHPLPNNIESVATSGNSHGMHVSGIAAGWRTAAQNPSRGVAPDAGIIGLRVFPVHQVTQADIDAVNEQFKDAEEERQEALRQLLAPPSGRLMDLLAGLDWLLRWVDDNADTPNSQIAAINLSLGFSCPSATPSDGPEKSIYDLITALRGKGAVTVAATGNTGQRLSIDGPSCFDNTIAVTATSGTAADEVIAEYANVSDGVDVAAPGGGSPGADIRSAIISDGYAPLRGTSMAAPMVAGAVALLREATPDLANDSAFSVVRAALQSGPRIDDTRQLVASTGPNTARPQGTVTDIPRLRAPEALAKLRADDVAVLDSVTDEPVNVLVSADPTEATVSFGAPTTAPRSVTGYTVTAFDTADETAVDTCVRGLRESRSCEFAGLTTGSTYRFDVTATNLFGVSAAAQSNPVTLTEPPPPPPPPPPAAAPAPAPAPAPEPAPVFSDTSGSVHAENVAVLVERGVLRGCATDRFCPRNTVTRGQFATILANVLELPARPPGSSGFVDVDGHTHAAGIRAVAAAGLFGGVSDTRFDPNAPMRRGQIASVLAGAAGLSSRPAAAGQFGDVAGSVHAGAIGAVVEAGLARGTSATTFAPSSQLPREQAATLVVNLIAFREN